MNIVEQPIRPLYVPPRNAEHRPELLRFVDAHPCIDAHPFIALDATGSGAIAQQLIEQPRGLNTPPGELTALTT